FGHNNRASGGNSNAVGSVNIASGIFSSAFGTFSEASGITSIAVGYQTKAEGGSSTALGFLATASGFGSYALGFGSNAKGYFSTTLGRETNAYSFGEVATGIFNTEYTPTDTTDFASEDRLFVIGNGTNTNNRSDALRIYKNGNMELNGALTIDSVYTFPVVDGTLDQVLATNGMGNLSWVSLTDSDNQSIDVLNLNGSTLEISLEGDEEETQELDLSGIEDHLFQFETCAQTSIIEQAASSSSVLGFTGWQSWTSTVDGRLGKIIVGTDILDAGVATLYEGEGTTGNVTLLATVDMEENGTVANFSALNISLVTGEQYTIKVDETVGANFIWDCTTTDVYSGGISDEGSNKDYVFEVFIAENCTESSVLEQNSSGDWNANFENGTVTAAAFVGDGSGLTNTNTDNQTIDKFQLNGTTLSLSLENDGEVEQTVDLSSLAPIGTIQMWATETPPTGWLICNGSTFNTSTYSELNAILGSNTLPDFRGRFPLGQYSNSDSQNLSGLTRRNIGDQAGAETHTLTINEMPAHSHNITYGERSKGGSGNNVTDLDSSGKTETTSSTGGNQAHNNMPPFYTINFIIKAE
ncbi:MAG: tail fiber protein, partial [Bacteroidota bacterium]